MKIQRANDVRFDNYRIAKDYGKAFSSLEKSKANRENAFKELNNYEQGNHSRNQRDRGRDFFTGEVDLLA